MSSPFLKSSNPPRDVPEKMSLPGTPRLTEMTPRQWFRWATRSRELCGPRILRADVEREAYEPRHAVAFELARHIVREAIDADTTGFLWAYLGGSQWGEIPESKRASVARDYAAFERSIAQAVSLSGHIVRLPSSLLPDPNGIGHDGGRWLIGLRAIASYLGYSWSQTRAIVYRPDDGTAPAIPVKRKGRRIVAYSGDLDYWMANA